MNVYFISGMAADRHMFRNIRLPKGFTEVHLDWIAPLEKESLEHYSWRIGQAIDHGRPFVIVGFSLGGMIAAEIARQYNPQKTILISSISCARQLPGYLRLLGFMRLHKILPVELLKRAALLKRKFTSEKKDDKQVMIDAIRASDPEFIRWGMEAALKWKAKEPPRNYAHIHGSYDEILPVMFTTPTRIIRGGGHLLVLTRPREVNRFLEEVLTGM